MAAPKPTAPTAPEDVRVLPAGEEPVELDERRFEELLKQPGVIVHHRNPELAARTFPPLKMTGTMSMAELRWLLGRIDDDELEAELDAERRARPDVSA